MEIVEPFTDVDMTALSVAGIVSAIVALFFFGNVVDMSSVPLFGRVFGWLIGTAFSYAIGWNMVN